MGCILEKLMRELTLHWGWEDREIIEYGGH